MKPCLQSYEYLGRNFNIPQQVKNYLEKIAEIGIINDVSFLGMGFCSNFFTDVTKVEAGEKEKQDIFPLTANSSLVCFS